MDSNKEDVTVVAPNGSVYVFTNMKIGEQQRVYTDRAFNCKLLRAAQLTKMKPLVGEPYNGPVDLCEDVGAEKESCEKRGEVDRTKAPQQRGKVDSTKVAQQHGTPDLTKMPQQRKVDLKKMPSTSALVSKCAGVSGNCSSVGTSKMFANGAKPADGRKGHAEKIVKGKKAPLTRKELGALIDPSCVSLIDVGLWSVYSSEGDDLYIVKRLTFQCLEWSCFNIDPCPHHYSCDCPDNVTPCKHIFCVRPLDTDPRPVPLTPLEIAVKKRGMLKTMVGDVYNQVPLMDWATLDKVMYMMEDVLRLSNIMLGVHS